MRSIFRSASRFLFWYREIVLLATCRWRYPEGMVNKSHRSIGKPWYNHNKTKPNKGMSMGETICLSQTAIKVGLTLDQRRDNNTDVGPTCIAVWVGLDSVVVVQPWQLRSPFFINLFIDQFSGFHNLDYPFFIWNQNFFVYVTTVCVTFRYVYPPSKQNQGHNMTIYMGPGTIKHYITE